MAPNSRSLPSVSDASSSELKLRRKTRRFKKGAVRRFIEKVVRKEFNKLHNKPNKQQKLKTKLRDKLARSKASDHLNATSSRLHDKAKYEIIITPTLNKAIIYTGSKIKGENGEPIKVAMYKNGGKVTSKRFASAKLEILPINGDFCEKGEENWSYEEFDSNVVRERDGVGPILAGPLVVDLENGEATLGDLVFRDNSSWARKRMFRIGARVLTRFKMRVKEGITKPLRVKDQHGKATEKPPIPKLEDGVECLKGVGKKRVSDLKKNGICIVRHFLRLFYMDESRLLEIMGIKSKLHESWKTTVKHAKKCKVGPHLYSHQFEIENKNVMLFFSSVYELAGAEINGHYKHLNEHTKFKKASVKKWKEEFYRKAGGREHDFTMGNNGPIPLEIDSSEVSLRTDNDPIGTEQDGKSADNICSTSEACVNMTRDLCESDLRVVESCMPNKEESSYIVPSLRNFVDQDSVQGGDSRVWDENQVSLVPEASLNNPSELIDILDLSYCDWSSLGDLDEAVKFIGKPLKKWVKKLSLLFGAVHYMKMIVRR